MSGKAKMKTRTDHIQWCKDRALELLNTGSIQDAFASMIADMHKHIKTESHVGIKLGTGLFFGGFLNTTKEMERWINGFN